MSERTTSERVPAIIQHMFVVTKHQFDMVTAKKSTGSLTIDVTVGGTGCRWYLDTAIKGRNGRGEEIDVVIRTRYLREAGRWYQDPPQLLEKGVVNNKHGDKINDIIASLLATDATSTGDLTQRRQTDTHGPRSNSVETRRASVIRV